MTKKGFDEVSLNLSVGIEGFDGNICKHKIICQVLKKLNDEEILERKIWSGSYERKRAGVEGDVNYNVHN